MDRLEVVPSQVRQAAEVMTAAARGISEELDRLSHQSQELALAWEGRAQEAFEAARMRSHQELLRHGQILEQIAQEARTLADAYGQTDRAAAARLGGQGGTGSTTVLSLGAN